MESSGTVEALLSLQEIDRTIREHTERLEELAREVEEGDAALHGLEIRVTETRKRLEEADALLRKYQRSVQAGRATVKRLEARAQEVQNMKQHVAVRAEMEAARRNLRTAEEEAMETMREVDDARDVLEELELEHELAREEHASRLREVEDRRRELEEEIAVQRDRKKNRETRLAGHLLRLYRTARGGRSDRALAPLTQDGVCGNCFTAVPLQRQADIRAGKRLTLCEGCGIILYASEG